jgi:hypothetical protein
VKHRGCRYLLLAITIRLLLTVDVCDPPELSDPVAVEPPPAGMDIGSPGVEQVRQ